MPQPRRRLVTILLVSTMTVMAGATISPGLPAIRSAFAGVENADVLVRLVLTLPALFTAIGSPLAGRLTDRLGRRPVLLGALTLYGVGGAAGGMASSIEVLLVTRALLGLAVGGLMTAATTLITDYYPGDRRSDVMGQQSAFMAGGGIVYVVLGGALADVSWRAPFAVYLAAFVLLAPVVLYVNEPDVSASDDGPDAVPIPWERVLPLYAMAFVGMASFYLIPVQIPFYLQNLGVSSGLLVGAAIAVSTAMGAVMGASFGRIRRRLGYLGTLTTLLGFFAAGYVVIGQASAYPGVIAGIGIGGVGMGLLMPTLNNWTGDLAPTAVRGTVLGGLTTCLFLGQFASPLLTQPLIEAQSVGTAFTVVGSLLGTVGLACAARLAWTSARSKHTAG